MSNELDFEIVDGRQSPTAAAVQRGVCRMLIHMGFSPLTEFSLRTGRRVDVAAINAGGEIIAVEIKSSLADFRSDQKWEEYLDYCDRFFFAVPIDFPREVLPEVTGMIVADQFGAEILRESPVDKLPGARRKAVTLLFARVAARRAHLVIDGGL
ncbi:MmcB family DNA repair protein [Tepidicaulis sp. LMO-SS28]|uniref:MmcB family DNA repair protein n=1 Tax=Tepidicaulis sp. LMO-SS28 TaxID=3447455 RepID=UPI003EE2B1F5